MSSAKTSTYNMEPTLRRELKSLLAKQGKNISEWISEKAKEEIAKAKNDSKQG